MSKKSKRAGKEQSVSSKPVAEIHSVNNAAFQKWFPLLLSLTMGVLYWVFSINSEGFYQHDEVTHYYQMITFWDNPMLYILDMWSRGGYKILYALPGMLGKNAIYLTNIFFTTGSCYLAYLIAKKYEFRNPTLAIILTGLQPMVINLSFRCYPEIPSMFFTALLVFTYINGRYIVAAIISSFLFSIRQEMAAVSILLGILFIAKRKWTPLLLLAWVPLTLNILGWIKYGDPQYVVTMMVKGGLQDTYQRNGFFYFWMMLPDIAGMAVIYLFIAAGAGWMLAKEKWQLFRKYHFAVIIFMLYFLMHCAFTSKSFGFGRSGGVARFMVVISPLIGVIATGGFNFFASRQPVRSKLIAGILSMVILFVFMSYYDEISPLVYNGFTAFSFQSENKQTLAIIGIAMIILSLIPAAKKFIGAAAYVIPALFAMLCIKSVELNYEDKMLEDAANWIDFNQPQAKHVYTHHVVFSYFYDQLQKDKTVLKSYDSTTVLKAKPGDIFVFENHYAIKDVRAELFDPSRFNVLKDFSVQGGSFRTYIVQKK